MAQEKVRPIFPKNTRMLLLRLTAAAACLVTAIAMSALPAKAVPLSYQITFTSVVGPDAPPTGTFTYDATTQNFTAFDIDWLGTHYDFTSNANGMLKFGNIPGCPTSLDSSVITFRMVTGACPAHWFAMPSGMGFYSGAAPAPQAFNRFMQTTLSQPNPLVTVNNQYTSTAALIPDTDGDGVNDDEDNCLNIANADQADTDSDSQGDACDACPLDADNDADGDDICGDEDNCPTVLNITQTDTDGDGIGDACNEADDPDGDEYVTALDNCPGVSNQDQANADGDIVGDACDVCPLDADNDADGDGICGDVDNCPAVANADQTDTEGDDLGDACDTDDDGDGVSDDADNCQFEANANQADLDNDSAGDVCDTDDDNDDVLDATDQCVPTPAGAVVNADGCAIAEICPCNNEWKNHGAYVSCVADASEDFVALGLITEAGKDAIVSAAGNSACGWVLSLGSANIWVGLANSDDVGIRFDLRAEVYRNGTELVGNGELTSVPGGSSGFNNAKQDTINLTPVAGVTFVPGNTLSIKLFVRNACSGSGKNSGRARLWYNDATANSRFDATIGNPATYYLLNSFALDTAPGSGPKKTIDVAAGAKCSPFKSFGTWSITLP